MLVAAYQGDSKRIRILGGIHESNPLRDSGTSWPTLAEGIDQDNLQPSTEALRSCRVVIEYSLERRRPPRRPEASGCTSQP